ncbi:MAG: response regulator [Burkholderiales bacterium]
MRESPPASSSRRILVADDNSDAATSLAMLLDGMGHATWVVNDGIATVEAAATFRPDIILLDIAMPRLNGFDACSRIRAQPADRQVVIVALTGWIQDEMRQRSREAGFDFYLIKPVEPDALRKLIQDCMPAGD